MTPRIPPFLRGIHNLLTRDLTWNDLNKSLNDDMRGMYEFYEGSMKSVEGERRGVKRSMKFVWHLFVAFLLKLTPPRRLMYAVAFVFIVVALSEGKAASAVYSFVIVTFLLAMELADKLITKDELSIARDIQLSLQPGSDVKVAGYDLLSQSEAAKQVGGDYYDVLQLPDGSTLVVIGDVSGKGISSALYVVKMQTALQLFATETNDLRELLIRLNSHVYGQLKRNYFLSLFLVKLLPDGSAEMCRAGHPPALLCRAKDHSTEWLKPNGIAVGMVSSTNGGGESEEKAKCFGPSLETQSLRMEKDDVLFLFTDGVIESVDNTGKEYGLDRVAELFKNCKSETLEQMRRCMIDDLIRHRSGADLRDDTTFLLLKKT
ncbi:MAG: serine/threonine-protein phosphatase [Ignavibacteriae bacterium]|nr:MAG: serine/threonine-protein phosphatase [Ignavibacteriota bacterium]